jgi:hypothetical protein
MTEYVLSIDPGLSSAIALLSYEPDDVPTLEYVTQFSGGAEAMSTWVIRRQDGGSAVEVLPDKLVFPSDTICEAFTARATKGFSYTTASLEALPVIGGLVALGLVVRSGPRYRSPKEQYLVGGKEAQAKKRQHRFLEDSGYYIGRKEIGETLKDYDDARSATAHGLAYIAKVKRHKPTFDMISNWVERNPV